MQRTPCTPFTLPTALETDRDTVIALRTIQRLYPSGYQGKNKALVLEALDTLFNERDYEAAERFWSPDSIQQEDSAWKVDRTE